MVQLAHPVCSVQASDEATIPRGDNMYSFSQQPPDDNDVTRIVRLSGRVKETDKCIGTTEDSMKT